MESNFQMTENLSTPIKTNKITKSKKPIEIRVNIVSAPQAEKTKTKKKIVKSKGKIELEKDAWKILDSYFAPQIPPKALKFCLPPPI